MWVCEHWFKHIACLHTIRQHGIMEEVLLRRCCWFYHRHHHHTHHHIHNNSYYFIGFFFSLLIRNENWVKSERNWWRIKSTFIVILKIFLISFITMYAQERSSMYVRMIFSSQCIWFCLFIRSRCLNIPDCLDKTLSSEKWKFK